MAALDLSGITRAPATRLVGASVGTDWQEVIVPYWCTVILLTTSHSIYYALANGVDGRTQPADGNAASGTDDKVSVIVTGSEGKVAIVMRDAEDRPVTVGVTPNRSIFVAAQSGTAAISAELGVGR
jgi:hypothetical protein